MQEKKNLGLLALVALALIVAAVATGAESAAPMPTEPAPATERAPAEPTEAPAQPADLAEAEKTLLTDPLGECDLQCFREFTECRQAAGGSGGPGFPVQAYEDCVDEYEWCLMEECGICI